MNRLGVSCLWAFGLASAFVCQPASAAELEELVVICRGEEVAQCTAAVDKEPLEFGAFCNPGWAPSLAGEWDCSPIEGSEAKGGLGEFQCKRSYACTKSSRAGVLESSDKKRRAAPEGRGERLYHNRQRSKGIRTRGSWRLKGDSSAGFSRGPRRRTCKKSRRTGKMKCRYSSSIRWKPGRIRCDARGCRLVNKGSRSYRLGKRR